MSTPCPHGMYGDERDPAATAGRDEISSCCQARVTYSLEDGDLYCKCCYGHVEWEDALQDEGMVYIIELPQEDTT